jgi:uncharacterized protein YyaL (SSP411 family)
MERKVFENPEIAEFMNRHFVNIKVDREERPDLDGIYMQAVQAMTGQGGWPMSVWLLPDGSPYYGGTYFPPVERYGMPSFRRATIVRSSVARTSRRSRATGCRVSGNCCRGLPSITTSTMPTCSGRARR